MRSKYATSVLCSPPYPVRLTKQKLNQVFEIRRHQPRGGKVGRLCDVEPVVEARVVGVREGDDDAPLLLNNLLVGNAVLVQDFGRDHARLVPHEVGAPVAERYKLIGSFVCNGHDWANS